MILTGVRAPVLARLDLDVVSEGPHWRMRFDAGAPARPVTIERMDADGIHALPLRFEGPARAGWARLHDELTCRVAPEINAAFLGDLEIASRPLPSARPDRLGQANWSHTWAP